MSAYPKFSFEETMTQYEIAESLHSKEDSSE